MNAGPTDSRAVAPADVDSESLSKGPSESPFGEDRAPDRRWAMAVLAAALALGLLRFVRLGQWSLWLDEVFTWGDAHAAAGRANALGYLLIRWTVEALGGDPTETALRLAPAVVGYLAIPLTYWAFVPIGGRLRAATAALVVAVSAWEIQWSQTARFYTMVQALGLVGGGLAIRGMLGQRSIVTLLGMGAAASGYFFHLQGALMAGAIGAAAWLFPPVQSADAKRSVRRLCTGLALLGLAATPLVWSVFRKYLAQKGVDDPLAGVAHFALTTGFFVTPTVAALALGAWLVALRSGSVAPSFIGAVAVIGGVALACLAAFAKVSAQYVFGLFPWIAMLAAWPVGAETGGGGSSKAISLRRLSWLLVLVLPLLAQTAVYFTVGNGQRAKWREAVELVAAQRGSTDVVVGAPAPVVEFYLTGGRETDVRSHDAVVQLDRYNPRPYRALVQEGRTAWFIVRNEYNFSMSKADRVAFEQFLSESCRMVKHFPVAVEARDLSVTVWRYDP